MSYTTKDLKSTSTDASWTVSFKTFDGDIAHHISNPSDSSLILQASSSVEDGELLLQIQKGDRIESIPLKEQQVVLKSWGEGDIIIRIIGKAARNGKVEFTWR